MQGDPRDREAWWATVHGAGTGGIYNLVTKTFFSKSNLLRQFNKSLLMIRKNPVLLANKSVTFFILKELLVKVFGTGANDRYITHLQVSTLLITDNLVNTVYSFNAENVKQRLPWWSSG